MAPPPVSIYITSLTSQPRVRSHIDLLHRSLRGLEIPYEAHDLVMDEQAKTRWQRAKPPGMVVGLPGYLVGGEWVGTMDDFEYAVETGTLPTFLKQDLNIDSTSSTNNKSGTIAEAELERLMQEMSEGDLDQLAGEMDAHQAKSAARSTNTPPATATAVLSTSTPPASANSRRSTIMSPAEPQKSRASMEEKAEVMREMMEAGTVDGLMKAVEKAEGKEIAE